MQKMDSARQLTLALAFALVFSSAAFAEQGAQRDWSYSGLQFPGPAGWGTVKAEYTLCKTGQLQSPINIVSASAQKAPRERHFHRRRQHGLGDRGRTRRAR